MFSRRLILIPNILVNLLVRSVSSETSENPFQFWERNPVQISPDAELDPINDFDSLVIVARDIFQVQVNERSFLKGFVDALQQQAKFDSDFNNVESFFSPHVPEYDNIKKVVYSPTGPLDRHYDDSRRFYDAAETGIKRLLKAGGKRPILAVLHHDDKIISSPRYEKYEAAAFLGAAQVMYVPLEIREDVPERDQKLQQLGYTTFGYGSHNLPLSVSIETGRIACRDICGSDPERMSAPNVASYVQELFANTPVAVDIVDDPAIIDKEYPLLGLVNRAAKGTPRHSARVIFLTYVPEGTVQRTLVFVGKGVTYDTGGADIKAGGKMAAMHRDKCGAAVVAGIFQAVAKLKPKGVKVLGAMAMVRNSVGPESYVADEIITSRAGVRVRVGNTDAEGRMAMVDLLCYMKEKVLRDGSPDPLLFTIATLTAHTKIAYGNGYSIIMENGAAAAERIGAHVQNAGELVGDSFEVDLIRREDYEFHKGQSEYEDLLQSNNDPTTETPRGHQTPVAFLIAASGLDNHDINSKQPLKYCHVDMFSANGPFPGVPTGSNVAAFTFAFLTNQESQVSRTVAKSPRKTWKRLPEKNKFRPPILGEAKETHFIT